MGEVGRGKEESKAGRWISGSLLSPNRLAGVVSLAMLAEHHLRLVLQSLHMLRILQASRLWGEAVPVSSLPKACLIPQPPKYQATPLFSAPPPPEEDYPPIPRWVYEEPSRRRSPEPLNPSSSFFPPKLPTMSLKNLGQGSVPGLKRTRAFMQANSVGSTASARNREMVSCRKRISSLAKTSLL